MIDFDFEFVQPISIEEARQLYQHYTKDGKEVMYFGGGTEFISRARTGEISTDVLMDIKHIQECQVYKLEGDTLFIGAGVSLSTLTDRVLFPLLATVARKIATQTARNKITVGGNLCSDLPYKEIYLPFLLAESTVVISTDKGLVERPIEELTELKEGEFLVQILTNKEMTDLPYTHAKRTKQSHISYPIVTMVSMKVGNHLRTATSGLSEKPMRERKVDQALNNSDDPLQVLSEKKLYVTTGKVVDDVLATKEYRMFVFKTLLQQMLVGRKEFL